MELHEPVSPAPGADLPGGTSELPSGWHVPQPTTLPRPTYAPVAMGFGMTLLFWGLATSLYISGVGLILCVLALLQWIGELCRDR